MFKIPSKKEIESLKKKYPVGTIIELDYMNDSQAPPSGTRGKVTSVDSMGQIHVDFTGLALIPGEDKFHIINEDIS